MTRTDPNNRRDEVLAAIREHFERTGEVLGTGLAVSKYHLPEAIWKGDVWPRWGDAIREAGLPPNAMTVRLDDDAMLKRLAELVRELGRMPAPADIRHRSRSEPEFPSPDAFKDHFGLMGEIKRALAVWARSRPDWQDVAAVAEAAANAHCSTPRRLVDRPPDLEADMGPLSDSFVPAVIGSLSQLARGDASLVSLHVDAKRLQVEFENRVGVAFRLLGFDVEPLGQGKGRVPDGRAACLGDSPPWVVIYDAKSRKDGYRLGTDDRTFKEYVQHEVAQQSRSGRQVYLVVVSSTFDVRDIGPAERLVMDTHVKALAFVEAAALVRAVDERLRDPATFDARRRKTLFARTAIVK